MENNYIPLTGITQEEWNTVKEQINTIHEFVTGLMELAESSPLATFLPKPYVPKPLSMT